MSDTLDAMRTQAKDLHSAGRLSEAIRLQVDLVNVALKAGQLTAGDYHHLGVMLFAAKDFASAKTAFEQVRKQDASFPGVAHNLGLCLLLTDRPREALPELHRALEERPESLDVLGGLTHTYGKLDDLENSRIYGEKSLLIKDSLAQPVPPGFVLKANEAPPFRIDRPGENLIAFSLFGNHERYTRGAVKNAVIAGGLYPGWQCVYFCDDTVPVSVRAALTEAGAQVRMMSRPPRFSDGLFWRFLVLDDTNVKRFLIRDCDSVINIRERRAVDEWLASGRLFHILRDNPAHTDLILAGLWGGIAGLLPPVTELVTRFAYNPITESRTADQKFLGKIIWPMIKHHCLIHDSVFRVFGAKEFPAGAELPPGRHVGDNDLAFRMGRG